MESRIRRHQNAPVWTGAFWYYVNFRPLGLPARGGEVTNLEAPMALLPDKREGGDQHILLQSPAHAPESACKISDKEAD